MAYFKKKIKFLFYIIVGIFIIVPVGIGISFPNTSKLVFCLITRRLPDSGHLTRIRNDLQSQDGFISMLVKHERIAVQRFNHAGEYLFVKKYIHKTPTSMFDIHSFSDFWEVWVRTDIVNGKPLTSYLIRLGLIKDTNAEGFFSNQCSNHFFKTVLESILGIYNKMFDWGIFKPVRLNITETDDTSTVSRERLDLKEWNEMVGNIHKEGKGTSFTKLKKTEA
jgi:hypothetical protein